MSIDGTLNGSFLLEMVIFVFVEEMCVGRELHFIFRLTYIQENDS